MEVQENPARSLTELSEFASRDHLESPETYKAALDAVLEMLNKEDGLIQLQDLPTIVIPDIHARRSMLCDIFCCRVEDGPHAGKQVFELLQQNLLNIVCVGDIVHSEERADWVINDNGDWTPELLDKEMVRSLGAAAMVMYLKIQYPGNFHCLRGNHDDMTGELTDDFRKFVGLKFENDECVIVDGKPVVTSDKGESRIVRDWVLHRGEGWGQPLLDLWGQFDKALPIFAIGTPYVVSHTLPQVTLSEPDIRNKNRPREITFQLTSKRGENRDAINGTLENLGVKDRIKRWFYGHTHVPKDKNGGKYDESPDGLLVRMNNQSKYVFAYVPAASMYERYFDPTKDVFIKAPMEDHFHR